MKYKKIILAGGNGYLGEKYQVHGMYSPGLWNFFRTELILKSRWVVPKRLLDNGYSFLFTNAEHAVKDILGIRAI